MLVPASVGISVFIHYYIVHGAGLSHWLLPLVDFLMHSAIYGVIYAITAYVPGRPWPFIVAVWIAAFADLAHKLSNADKGGLSMRKWGYDIYISGDLTLFGAIYQIGSPGMLSAILLTVGSILVHRAKRRSPFT